jgi:membrane dipeptidase
MSNAEIELVLGRNMMRVAQQVWAAPQQMLEAA